MPHFKQQLREGNPRCRMDMDCDPGYPNMKDFMIEPEFKMQHNENIDCFPLAMAYVPWQCFNKVYSPEKALRAGTIFPELDLPWKGCD